MFGFFSVKEKACCFLHAEDLILVEELLHGGLSFFYRKVFCKLKKPVGLYDRILKAETGVVRKSRQKLFSLTT